MDKNIVQVIFNRSQSLYERLDGLSDKEPCDLIELDKIISYWCNHVFQNDISKFNRRLSIDGISYSDIHLIIQPRTQKNLPTWTNILEKIISCAYNINQLDRIKNKDNVPFIQFYSPFIQVASSIARLKGGYRLSILSPSAFACLENILLDRLIFVCAQVLTLKFSIYRAAVLSSSAEYVDKNTDNILSSFIDNTLVKMEDFFLEYPVLARVCSEIIEYWLNFVEKLTERVSKDHKEIGEKFFKGHKIDKVTNISSSLSDSHNSGEFVVVITFDDHHNIVYKPKDVNLEEKFNLIINWINNQELVEKLDDIKVINKESYGWCEYVEHNSCISVSQVRSFYKKLGNLLCLLYALEATDFHNENIISSGETPFLVDMETLATPRVFFDTNDIDETVIEINDSYWHSVLQVGLLPYWNRGQDGKFYDVSGIGGIYSQETSFQKISWSNVNRDLMSIAIEPAKTKAQANSVMLHNKIVSPADYTEDIVDGFTMMYRFLVSKKKEFLYLLNNSESSGLLNDQYVRFVFRPTRIYGVVLKTSLHPKLLKDGLLRSIHLDILARGILRDTENDDTPKFWPLLKFEHESLYKIDIPIFFCHTNSKNLYIDNKNVISNTFIKTGCDLIAERINQLSEQDLERQVYIIRASLFSHKSTNTLGLIEPVNDLDGRKIDLETEKQTLMEESIKIFDFLCRKAIYQRKDIITWQTITYRMDYDKYQVEPMGFDIYNGAAGISLFLSANYRITRSSDARDMALFSIKPLINSLKLPGFQRVILKDANLGIGSGIASIIYSLTKIGQLLEDESLIMEALKIAELITKDIIIKDRQYDIINGCSGLILALISLQKIKPSYLLRETLINCGRHLIASKEPTDTNTVSWRTIENRFLTGFSHGAAGIAYALLKLYEFSSEIAFLDGAMDAINYESSVFSVDSSNWPDLRKLSNQEEDNGQKIFLTRWCHGSSGIGLARLGTLDIIDNQSIRDDIYAALKSTVLHGISNIDHVCCGNFGRLEFLNEVARKLSLSDISLNANRQLSHILNRARLIGHFATISGNPFEVYNPGFFQGYSGIGYSLLRWANFEKLPSILTWE